MINILIFILSLSIIYLVIVAIKNRREALFEFEMLSKSRELKRKSTTAESFVDSITFRSDQYIVVNKLKLYDLIEESNTADEEDNNLEEEKVFTFDRNFWNKKTIAN